MRYIQYFLTLVVMSQVLQACFITDCPIGLGKRSMGSKKYYGHNIKHPECPVCGPAHLQNTPETFRCFGPELCCSPTRGCLPKTSPGLRNCAFEDMTTTPCENQAKRCDTAGQAGQCVSKDVCCNPKGQCARDETCTDSSNVRRILQDLELTLEEMIARENTDIEY